MGIGAELRERRLQYGWSLPEVADSLRIQSTFLQSIESDQFEKLPDGPYAIGFIRSYATQLGFDAESVVQRFRKEQAHVAVRTPLIMRMPLGESRTPGWGILGIALILLAAAWAGWSMFRSSDHTLADSVPPVPDRLMEKTVAPAEPAVAQMQPVQPVQSDVPIAQRSETPAATAAPAPILPSSAQTPSSSAAVRPQPSTPSTDGDEADEAENETFPASSIRTRDVSPADTAGPAAGTVFGDDTEARVQIRAIADSWVQVKGSGGATLFTKILHAGDTYRVPDQPGLTFMTGNAGGLEIVIDRIVSQPLGTTGQILRNVPLDQARLAAKKTP